VSGRRHQLAPRLLARRPAASHSNCLLVQTATTVQDTIALGEQLDRDNWILPDQQAASQRGGLDVLSAGRTGLLVWGWLDWMGNCDLLAQVGVFASRWILITGGGSLFCWLAVWFGATEAAPGAAGEARGQYSSIERRSASQRQSRAERERGSACPGRQANRIERLQSKLLPAGQRVAAAAAAPRSPVRRGPNCRRSWFARLSAPRAVGARPAQKPPHLGRRRGAEVGRLERRRGLPPGEPSAGDAQSACSERSATLEPLARSLAETSWPSSCGADLESRALNLGFDRLARAGSASWPPLVADFMLMGRHSRAPLVARALGQLRGLGLAES